MAEVFPGSLPALHRALLQECIFSGTQEEVKEVSAMLEAIHAQEDKEAALKKIGDIIEN